MNRDAFTTTLWQDDFNIRIPGEEISHDVFDVIIIGAGITGITTGLRLQQAGKRCLILEAHTACFGTTSATTAHLNTVLDASYPELIKKFGTDNALLIAQGAKEAISLIRAHIEQYQIDCDFEEKTGYLYAQNKEEDAQLEKMLEGMLAVGIEARPSLTTPVPVPFTTAIRVPGQAQFHPLKYLSALLLQFLLAGGAVREATMVQAVEQQDGIQEISSTTGRYRATHVVYATHIPPGVNLLHFRCAPYRSYVLGVELADHAYPDALVYDIEDPYHYFRTARHQGAPVLIVGGEDHKTGHEVNTEQVFRELEAYARRFFKIAAVPYRWSSQYYEPADGLPYIGLLPGNNDHLYVATGYSGNGMIFGTLAGRILCDLITGNDTPYADLLAPSRIKPVAGFSNFIKENADVVKHFIGDRLSAGTLEAFAGLSVGEGRVVNYENQSIAVYKDEQGRLFTLDPVCPHAGCMVQWNPAERSWDCPCHGSRFDITGAVLNGPAQKALQPLST
ncbi:FAD-dependent oxidoreductase [Niabella sp. CC-SYL272]|uniref:FAD-dependent oxidoreductase n=1 Tax=Niabella agricola TaxID=2891571 RepID=UPI001F23955F|nr:FAD-dependent oxidoreductase [Niabella agricola]MCF3108164.1 FAD-dependent oxidoreductase [Niabella agricola]